MTTDTSRDAVEALGLALHVLGDQAEIADNGPSDFATTQHTAADTLAALLDERDRLAANRDAWVSDAMTSTTELEQRIRDLEAGREVEQAMLRNAAVQIEHERARARADRLVEWKDRLALAVRASAVPWADVPEQNKRLMEATVAAILADTETREEGDL